MIDQDTERTRSMFKRLYQNDTTDLLKGFYTTCRVGSLKGFYTTCRVGSTSSLCVKTLDACIHKEINRRKYLCY